MVWKAALGAIAICISSSAAAQTFREQVISEKQEMANDVDQSILKVIRENPEILGMELQLSQIRREGFWLAMAPSLGVCHANGGNETYVAWLSAADFIGPDPAATKAKGIKVFTEMKQQNLLAQATAARRAAFCKVRITAVREILSERFGVK